MCLVAASKKTDRHVTAFRNRGNTTFRSFLPQNGVPHSFPTLESCEQRHALT
jgi:hypothetical protein